MEKFQIICRDTLGKGLKFGHLYFVCMSSVSSIKMVPKNHWL